MRELDLGGRSPPKDSITSTDGQGLLRRFAAFCERTDRASLIRRSFPFERERIMRQNISDEWTKETQRDWTANAHYLDRLDRVYPDAPRRAPEQEQA
jgi:hypothetical protein